MDGGFGYLALLLLAPLVLSWLFACVLLPFAAVRARAKAETTARRAAWQLLTAYAFLVFGPLVTTLASVWAAFRSPAVGVPALAFGLTIPAILLGVAGVFLASVQVARAPRSPRRHPWWPWVGPAAIAMTPALGFVLLVGGATLASRWPIPEDALPGSWVSAVKHENYQFEVKLKPDGTYHWVAREVDGKLVDEEEGRYRFDARTHHIRFENFKGEKSGFESMVEVNPIFGPKLSIPISESQRLVKEEPDHQ